MKNNNMKKTKKKHEKYNQKITKNNTVSLK